MKLSDIIAELEGAAQQEAAGIHVLETTRFEPELDRVAVHCLAAAKRRAEALAEAASLLRRPDDPARRLREVASRLGELRDRLRAFNQVLG